MTSELNGERGTGSTRWVPRGERLSSSARGKTQHARRAYRWFGLRLSPADRKVTITVTYRGGAECWYNLEARGRHGVFPGVASLHDIMREIRQTG